ncbi:MAG: 4-(cytidine 5'-diphospho)-2-C-methyl-D-erythritol kinase [Myxococcota bacterium]
MSADSGLRRVRDLAPAKVNLGLRITGQRPDGNHELESVFLPLDLGDEVELEVAPARLSAVALTLHPGPVEGVPGDASNLAYRAAEAFLEVAGRAGCIGSVRIRLHKRIPAAAGLGGGSSDAGVVLRSLARLFPAALSAKALGELALDLGADVPFFLDPRPARVSGIGERIEPLTGWPAFSLVLANPGLPLATAEVFRVFDSLHLDRCLERAPLDPRLLSLGPGPTRTGVDATPALAWSHLLENDLESAAIRLCPPVARLREQLRGAGARAVGMSGSGPTLFGIFEDREAAAAGLARADFQPPVWARVAITLGSR